MLASRMGNARSLAAALFLMVGAFLGYQGYKLHWLRQHATAAMMRAINDEPRWRHYFHTYGAWPDAIYTPPSRLVSPGYPFWLSHDGRAFLIDVPVPHDDGRYHYYPGGTDLRGVALWTTDGGETWHCGPVWIPRYALPESCRETDLPAYTGPT